MSNNRCPFKGLVCSELIDEVLQVKTYKEFRNVFRRLALTVVAPDKNQSCPLDTLKDANDCYAILLELKQYFEQNKDKDMAKLASDLLECKNEDDIRMIN